jgi:cell division protease FtsH
MDKLENLAKALLERETLTGEEIDKAMRGELKSTSSDSGKPPIGLEKEKRKEERKSTIEGIPSGLNPQPEA